MEYKVLDDGFEDSKPYIGPQHYVGFWVRAIAAIVDGICLIPLKFLNSLGVDFSLVMVLTTMAYPVYKIGMEHYFGATLGKQAMRIHVVNEEGKKPMLGEAIIRNIFWLAPAVVGVVYQLIPEMSHSYATLLQEAIGGIETLGVISALVVIFHKEKQAVHDMLAKTHVLYKMVG